MKTVYQNCLLFILTFIGTLASAQAPVLSSYPVSANVIFLDFDGHTVTGTSWNSSGAIVCEEATLSASQITTIYNRVAKSEALAELSKVCVMMFSSATTSQSSLCCLFSFAPFINNF